jgi:hypothetical protein
MSRPHRAATPLPWRDCYPSMAMAGGTQPEHLAKALASVPEWVKTKL